MSSNLKQENKKTSNKPVLNEILPGNWGLPRKFTIITWGSTGTSWLSKVLNYHPEIICMHELASILAGSKLFSSNDFWKKFDPIDYMKIISRIGTHHHVAGDIHSIKPEHVLSLKKYFGERRFHSVVIEREPISRLKSTISMYYSALSKQYQLYDIKYIDDIIFRKKIDLPQFDYEHKLFVHGVNLLNSIKQETEHNCGKMFRMEDLISDTKYLKSLIEEISGGEISADDELLNKMIKTSATNPRASKEKIEFEDWQIDVIKKTVDDKAWDLYLKIGYAKPHFL